MQWRFESLKNKGIVWTIGRYHFSSAFIPRQHVFIIVNGVLDDWAFQV